MGLILTKIFDLVESHEGYDGRIRLVEALAISKDKAKSVPDEPQIIEFAKQQASLILGKDISRIMK